VRLLVFDNCEHVLDSAGDLIEAISAAPATVRILATSREGLGIADEQVWPVRSLEAGAAVDLFVERAHNVAPNFSADEADAVTEICVRLDGIPLAIELAASRMAAMTATEVRDRLDQRFKLLVGSRRALDRHHTLRHAVSWSYDLLDDNEKTLLMRCSVFAAGFVLESVCAVGGSDDLDDYAVLDLLDALARKSLLIADRSAGRTRYSGQREAYGWFTTELANLRKAFRWAADRDDLDTAATIGTFVGLIGFLAENYEPTAWAEELIESARAVGHPRLAYLYQIASVCYMAGRSEQGLAYAEAIQTVTGEGRVEMPFGFEGLAGGAYLLVGRPEGYIEWCRAYLDGGRDTHGLTRAALVNSLVFAGFGEEAIVAAEGLVEAAEATGNPWALSYALLSHGFGPSRHQSRPRARGRAPRPGDHPRKWQSLQRVAHGEYLGRAGGQTRRSADCTGLHRAGDPPLPRCR
jgi:hypothetical protein